MNLSEFLAFAATRRPLDTEEIGRFMDEMSDSARRITFELNGSYHTPDEVRALLSRLFGYEIDPSVRVFPPFYTDFGRNIAVGKGVFINACCHFQDHGGVTLGDGCQIGHNVVFATLDHGIAPAECRTTVPAADRVGPERLGGFERDDSARRHHRRQCRRGGRCGRCERRGGEYHRGRRSRPPAPPYRRVARNRCSGKAQRKKSSTTCARITRTNIDSG